MIAARRLKGAGSPQLKKTERNFYQRGEGEAGCLAIIVLAVCGLAWAASGIFFGEREGSVKFDDCREVIRLQPDTLQKFYKTFTCSSSKTKSGGIISEQCVHIDNDSTLFSSSHSCATAYVYTRHDEGCTNLKYPYLHYDDKCYSEP